MSVELIAISAFVVAILGGLSQCIQKINLKKCHVCCIDSDCRDQEKITDIQIKELSEKIEKNQKKICKNKNKLDSLKNKRRLSNIPETPDSLESINSFEEVTEI
jgi:uncharacterized coiled-coil protein SlyX